jgi:Pyruvate/2-oxoglutarate dehydrogenase complex, dehydrogenase (E1) component, eukaryotic type, alpha subunit
MRGCGHAHHHDDLYLGAASGNPPGYVDRELLRYWAEKDPLPNHRELLIKLGVGEQRLNRILEEEEANVSAARKELEKMDWPEGNSVVKGVTSFFDATSHEHQLSRVDRESEIPGAVLKPGEYAIEFSDAPNSWTFSRSIQNAMVSLAEQFGEQDGFMGEEYGSCWGIRNESRIEGKGASIKTS